MIYITGDTHSEFKRLTAKNFPIQKNLTKDDYLIICGDFGGVWDNSERELHWLDWLNIKPFTTLFVDGNHENFDLLNTYPTEQWNGGKVQFIRPSIIRLNRGQIFNLNNKRIFTMGGAQSHDIQDGILEPDDPDFRRKKHQLNKRNAYYRINHVSWWKEELPSDAEYEEATANLTKHGWKVDYIISHCAPSSVASISSNRAYQADCLTDFLQEVSERCEFQKWFCGHYHKDTTLLGKYRLLYEDIIEIKGWKESTT